MERPFRLHETTIPITWNGHFDYMEPPLVSKPTFRYSAERPWGRHFVRPFHGTATKKATLFERGFVD